MDADKTEIETFIRVGKELGLEGAELREWVEEQQEWAREDQAWERERQREREERQREREEREREWAREDKERERIAAKEAEELQLKLQQSRIKLGNSVHETTPDFEATDKSVRAFDVKETVHCYCEEQGQVAVSCRTENADESEAASKDCDPVAQEVNVIGQDEVESISDGSERAVLNAAQYSKEAVESVDAFEPRETVVEYNYEEQGQAANSCNEEGDSEEPAVVPKEVGLTEEKIDESVGESEAVPGTDKSDSNGHLDEPGQCHVLGSLSVKENERRVTSYDMAAESSRTCEQAEFSEVENVGRDAASCLEVGGIYQCLALESDAGHRCTNGFTEEMALPEPRQSSDFGMSRRLAMISVAEGQDRQWMPRQSTVGRGTDKCTKERSLCPRRARDRPRRERGMRGCLMTWDDNAHLSTRARCGPWRWRKKSGARPHRVRFKSISN